MNKMFHVSKNASIKNQIEEVWKTIYKEKMETNYFNEIEWQLFLTENNSDELEEQLKAYLYEMPMQHQNFVVTRGMNTNYYKIDNGDFIIAIDDEVYIG